MKELSDEEVRELARLSRLALHDEEVAVLRGDLTSILVHMDALAEVDTSGVEPMTHPMPEAQALRTDSAAESLARETVFSQCPRHDGESFVVPSIIPGAES